MNNGPSPLNVTITSGSLDTGGDNPTPFTTNIPGYEGDRLYCQVSSDGTTLNVLIDDVGPDKLSAVTAATKAAVTVVYGTTTGPTWSGDLKSPYTGITPFEFAVELSANLLSGMFMVRPKDTSAEQPFTTLAPAAENPNAHLGYIAIEVDGKRGVVQLYYLNVSPQIKVKNFRRLTTATIVEPHRSPGSIGGPMGIELTS